MILKEKGSVMCMSRYQIWQVNTTHFYFYIFYFPHNLSELLTVTKGIKGIRIEVEVKYLAEDDCP